MRDICTHCGIITRTPISEITRQGVTVHDGPLCRDCWQRISRAIDDDPEEAARIAPKIKLYTKNSKGGKAA